MAITLKTQYIGIYLQSENNRWWIMDDLGGEEYYGSHIPTSDDVESYRNNLMEWLGYTY
jgi:hypothetical protein